MLKISSYIFFKKQSINKDWYILLYPTQSNRKTFLDNAIIIFKAYIDSFTDELEFLTVKLIAIIMIHVNNKYNNCSFLDLHACAVEGW